MTAAVASVGLVSAVPSAASAAPATLGGTTVLSSDVLPLGGFAPTGLAAVSHQYTVAVALAHPNSAGEDALLRSLYDPASPDYRHFLTIPEYDQRFGVPQASSDALVSWLAGGGLHVVSTSAARDLVVATGNTAQVETLFVTVERTYRIAGIDFIANDRGPTVPAGLGITTVMGLNTWQHAGTPKRNAAPAAKPAQSFCQAQQATGFCFGTLDITEAQSIYDATAAPSGVGQSVAVLGEGVLGDPTAPAKGSVIADLRQFESAHHFPAVPVSVHCVLKGDCGTDTSGGGEWDIDSQMSTGFAPGVDHLDFYFAQDLTDANQAAMVGGWLSDPNGPLQANASFGECEQGPYNALIYPLPGNADGGSAVTVPTGQNDPLLGLPLVGPTGHQLGDNLEAYLEVALKGAAITGRTLFSSTGDTGAGCTALIADGIGPNGIADEPVPLISMPAGSRFATAVGGTVLYGDNATPAKRVQEYSWTYTGGGSSPFLTAPTYQQNVPHLNGTCVSDPDGGTGATGQLCRGVPDVAAISGDAFNGIDDVSGGNGSVAGGTSLSSPIWMGAWARIQSASNLPGGLGFANYTLYALGKNATTAGDFYDVTIGNNGVNGCPTAAGGPPVAPCIAQAGWDYVSGWGVPDVAKLARDAASAAPPVQAPDAPWAALLALVGAAAVAGWAAMRRRRPLPA